MYVSLPPENVPAGSSTPSRHPCRTFLSVLRVWFLRCHLEGESTFSFEGTLTTPARFVFVLVMTSRLTSRFLATQPSRDLVILTESRSAVLRLVRPATLNPATSLALRHAAMLVSIQQIPAHTGIPGNTRSDELTEAAHKLPGCADCVSDPILS